VGASALGRAAAADAPVPLLHPLSLRDQYPGRGDPGFVGAGGIGFYVQTYLRLLNYPAAASVLLVQVALVMAVDFASSRLRARLV
jgi:hypothetical protein